MLTSLTFQSSLTKKKTKHQDFRIEASDAARLTKLSSFRAKKRCIIVRTSNLGPKQFVIPSQFDLLVQ